MSKEIIAKVYIDKRISQKTNNPYDVLVIEMPNGYKLTQFMSPELRFMIETELQKSGTEVSFKKL